ncbi:MAG: two-component regulator propeller domain-containing protein, partial [Bacteroidia bacterium]
MCCSGPPAHIEVPSNTAADKNPGLIAITAPVPVKATWVPSSKGLQKARVEAASFIPFTDSVFDVQAMHPLAAAPDSSLLDLYSLPSVALDLKTLPVKKVKPEIVLLGRPLKVKAGLPLVEDKFAKGLMEMGQDQGLPGTAVSSLLQDSAGRLWMATDNGLSVFNGEYIYTWLKRSGLSRDRKNTVCLDKKGHIWAAGNGVDEIIPEEGIVRHYGKQQGLTTNSAASAMTDSKGRICILSNEGLDILDPAEQTVIHIGKNEGLAVSLYINRMIEDHEGRLWLAGNGGGVSIYDPARKKLYTLTDKHGLSNNDIRSIIEDKNGAIWMGGWNGGVDCFDHKRGVFYHLRRKHGIAFHYIHSLLQDHNGKMWIAYLGAGVDIYDPVKRAISHIYGKEGIAKSNSLCLLETSDSCVWIGTNGGGVIKYDPSIGDIYNYESRWWYTQQPIRALLEDNEKRIWLSTSGEGIDIYDPGKRSICHFLMGTDWTDAWQNILVDDGRGHILMGSDSRFSCYDKKTNKIVSWGEDEGLIHNGIKAISLSGKDIMLGTREGIDKCDSAVAGFMHLNAPGDPCTAQVTCMTRDQNGNVWAGTYNAGVFMFDPKTSMLSHFSKAQGFGDSPVECIMAGHDNNIWVGTLGDGLKKIDQRSFHLSSFTLESGLADMAVTSLVEKNGKIYAGTGKGLSVIPENGGSGGIRNYGKQQGFRTRDFNTGAAIVSREGTIWWGIGDMLSIY